MNRLKEKYNNEISVLDKKSDLYLIQKDSKYGVVKSGNITIIIDWKLSFSNV